MAQLPSLRSGGGESKEMGAPGSDSASAADEKAGKTRKVLIEKLALAQEVQRLVMGKRIRPLLITEVREKGDGIFCGFAGFVPVSRGRERGEGQCVYNGPPGTISSKAGRIPLATVASFLKQGMYVRALVW